MGHESKRRPISEPSALLGLVSPPRSHCFSRSRSTGPATSSPAAISSWPYLVPGEPNHDPAMVPAHSTRMSSRPAAISRRSGLAIRLRHHHLHRQHHLRREQPRPMGEGPFVHARPPRFGGRRLWSCRSVCRSTRSDAVPHPNRCATGACEQGKSVEPS
jgi:hypothetical protein